MWESDHKEGWALKNWCLWTVVLEKMFESPLDRKEIKLVNPKGNQPWIIHWMDWCWSWSSNTFATRWEEPTHRKRPWCWKTLRTGEEGDDRASDGWMASSLIYVWANSGRQWRAWKPGILKSMGLQRVGHDWVTEQEQQQ